jgi:predicted RNA binding protein YcfA (HicA-like mRNA interferase family)
MSDGPLPILRPHELIRALERMGFRRMRRSPGGHLRYVHPDGRRTTVPMHKGKTLGRGLLRKILRDIGLGAEELSDYLK